MNVIGAAHGVAVRTAAICTLSVRTARLGALAVGAVGALSGVLKNECQRRILQPSLHSKRDQTHRHSEVQAYDDEDAE